MTRSGIIFIGILFLNALIAGGYLFFHLIFRKKRDNRLQFVLQTIIMLLCPIVGVLYFALSYLKYRYYKRGDRDLSDVEFSKKRQAARMKADEERERNIVAVDEAILVSDKEKKRANMLNILLGDTEESFSAIARALNSDDSEVAHYAASFLQNKMDVFREKVHSARQKIDQGDVRTEDCQNLISDLIRYMNQMLKQQVFTRVEQRDYVEQMEALCELLIENAKDKMIMTCYEAILGRLMELDEYDRAELWGNRLYEQYPEQLPSYALRLKMYFETGQKDKFFVVLDQLRASSVVVDNQTLALIRMIQR